MSPHDGSVAAFKQSIHSGLLEICEEWLKMGRLAVVWMDFPPIYEPALVRGSGISDLHPMFDPLAVRGFGFNSFR